MNLLSQNISQVRVFPLPAGIADNGTAPPIAGVALVKWHSAYFDKLHQVYINGKLAGVAVDVNQRQLVVPVPFSEKTAVRAEVFAVESQFANKDMYPGDAVQQGRVELAFAKLQSLPGSAKITYHFDDGIGQVDYQNAIGDGEINLWQNPIDKCGFGMSCFGKSDFGYDGAAAVGFGKGSFANGQFGFDADMMKFQSQQLAAGKYKFGIKVHDEFGNDSVSTESQSITVIPPAEPAGSLAVADYDKDSGELIFDIK